MKLTLETTNNGIVLSYDDGETVTKKVYEFGNNAQKFATMLTEIADVLMPLKFLYNKHAKETFLLVIEMAKVHGHKHYPCENESKCKLCKTYKTVETLRELTEGE